MKQSDVIDLLADIASVWQHFKTDGGVADTWYRVLESFSKSDIDAAFVEYCLTAEHPPRPASLTSIVASRAIGALPEPDDAWEQVTREMRRHPWSPYRTFVPEVDADGTRRLKRNPDGSLYQVDTGRPEFSNDMIHQAVNAAGGWKYISQHDDPQSLRERFTMVYKSMRQRVMREVALSGGDVVAALEAPSQRMATRQEARDLVAVLQSGARQFESMAGD